MLYLINYDASSTTGWGKHMVYIQADDLYDVNRKWLKWSAENQGDYIYKLKSIEVIDNDLVV